MRIQILFVCLYLVCFSEKSLAQRHKELTDNVEVFKNIPYVTYGDRTLLLDIYKPQETTIEKLPAILVIRGGGWQKGDKEGYATIAAALTAKGFAAVCIEYRTAQEALFPAAVFDTKNALQWIKTNADKYGIDANKIGAIGGSAGAHLALLLGVSADVEALNPESENADYSLQAVVALASPTNFHATWGPKHWLGKPFGESQETWRLASPVTHIDSNSPPALLIHSSNDKVVDYSHSILALEKYGEAGVHCDLDLIPDAAHAFWFSEKWFDYTIGKSVAFFQEYLK